MKTMIVNIRDNDERLFVDLFKKMRVKTHVLTEEEKEDSWLVKMIDEAEQQEGEVPEEEIIQLLKSNGAKI